MQPLCRNISETVGDKTWISIDHQYEIVYWLFVCTPILKSLHWLKVDERIEHKLLCLTYKVLTTTQPSYLHNLIFLQPPRSTRSSSVVTLSRPPTISISLHLLWFPNVFSVANFRLKRTESRSDPMVEFRLATGEFDNYWCVFVK